MVKHTGTFKALGVDGREYSIHIFSDYISVSTHQDRDATIEGLKQLRTSDGYSVNRVGKGEYKIVQTGVILRSFSPEAP